MEFISPNILWGLLGLSAPILIHFWNQRQSKVMPWAAMQFFISQKQTVSKGFKINDLWLLLLRILAVFLLTFLLAQPLFNKIQKNSEKPSALWMVDTPQIKEEFKFEIENANRNDQEIKWLKTDNDKVNLLDLQAFVNSNQDFFKENKVKAFLTQEPFLDTDTPLVFPDSIEVKMATMNSSIVKAIHQNLWFYVNPDGIFESSIDKPSGVLEIVHKGTLRLQLDIKTPQDKNLIQQGLKAISEVYNFAFDTTSKNPDLSIKVNEGGQIKIKKNLNADDINISENIQRLTQTGALPEELLTGFLKALDLDRFEGKKDLKHIENQYFVYKSNIRSADISHNKILILFLIVLIIERFLALKMNK